MCWFYCEKMGQLGEILGFGLQARIELDRGARTVVELLRDRMDGGDRMVVRRKSITERLGLKGMACCGATWGLGPANTSMRDDDIDVEIEGPVLGPQFDVINLGHSPITDRPIPCVGQSPAAAGMNLAAALAAERQLRAVMDSDNGGANQSPSPNLSPTRPNSNDESGPGPGTVPGTPFRVSLMRLLEEADGYDGEKKTDDGGVCDSVCCVCMGRKKGAAFIPCGHTFCRVCSRELWLNRGYCPLCNRSILEILDIY